VELLVDEQVHQTLADKVQVSKAVIQCLVRLLH